MPGDADIQIQLELIQNPKLQCNELFNFYAKFDHDAFDFKFIIDNEKDQYLINQPFVSWKLQYEGESEESLSGIQITIPADEQYKLPIWTDIKLIMYIEWTSKNYSEYRQPGTFQNVMYTMQLSPKTAQLSTALVANTKEVSRGQTLTLMANQTTVMGINPIFVQDQMKYKWFCPENLQDICDK